MTTIYNEFLAKYAVSAMRQPRDYKETAPLLYRTEFERDRDRIIHCSAFRRLAYKTQVFVNHEGDLFRTRLTHSLEVAQIGRSIAKALNLNTALVEAISLAHDLGHTPFGHVGQEVLNSCLKKLGYEGFEHNLQSLRIVESVEERYANFNGLNLSFDTKEGILKHCSLKKAASLGTLGLRFLHNKQASLEAQIANIADEIAYNYHDIDDGLRSGLISLEQLCQIDFIAQALKNILIEYPTLEARRLHKELTRTLINMTIYDLIENSLKNLQNNNIKTLDDVLTHSSTLIANSTEIANLQRTIKKFLHKNLYQHSLVMQLRFKASKIIEDLFHAYIHNHDLLPADFKKNLNKDAPNLVVVDYLSGMTDRYALKQHNKLYSSNITMF